MIPKFKAILKLLKPENKSKVSRIHLHHVRAKHVLCKWHSQSPAGHKMHGNAKMLKVSVTQSTVVPVPQLLLLSHHERIFLWVRTGTLAEVALFTHMK